MEILNFKSPLSDLIYILKKGGSIHIKKKNRGKFTESAKRAGMGVQEYARHILANKDKYSSTLVKRANFARNAKKFKHENGGILKAQEGTNELYPAGITIPSSETIDFFKDFTQRYKKLNHIDKSQLIQDLISKDKAIVSNKGLPKYNTDTKQIFIPSDDVGVSTYSHELVHKLNDLVLERTNKERKLLNDAYPLSIAKHVYGRAPEDMRNELIEDERFSTNTELRRKISSDYGNVLGKKLNKVIKSLSTNDIINYVNNINGYVGESDFLKYPEHIIDGKTLFEHWKEDIGDVPEYYNMPWEELPKSEQNQWQYLYDSREGVAPNYMVFDEDKPKAIKKALIKVAQESKSNDIRSKNLINVSRQGGILKAQDGTGNLYTPHPLSPVGIALNQARAMAKMKGEQHLPPGVKEVVGPDGKKVAIRTEQPLVPLEQSIAEWLPGTGDVAEVGYIANDVKNGNLGSAALAAAMVALPGNVGKVLRKSDIPASKSTKVVVEESKPRWTNTSQSKLSESERLGIPKGERNQPGKPRSPRAVEYDVVDGRPTKEFLDDYHAYAEALKTGGRRIDITDMFDSSWYKQRLLNQGLTEEQADQLILRLKDRVSPENLVVVDGLNSVRNFRRIEDGIPVEMTPERLTLFGRHTTGPGLSGKSLIELSTKADPEEIILHEIGGHRSQPLVADFKDIYLDQALTNLGLQRHMKIGKTADYGLNWGEVRARALTIAKQMSDAGWNPNSPEQVNVWLNKYIFTNSPKNANQGALYYDRPRFIKAVSEGLKNGGKL